MFIAHAPSGYLLASLLLARRPPVFASARLCCLAAVVGAVAPDADLLYAWLGDGWRVHHHRYPSHWPVCWLAGLLLARLWLRWRPGTTAEAAAYFALGGLLHLMLDSVVGDIWWFAPLVDRSYSLDEVLPKLSPWWLNFILHRSFALELLIIAWAALRYRAERARTWTGLRIPAA